MAMINEGKYRARALGGTLGETKKGDPQVEVKFDVQFEDGNKPMTWRGSFNGDAKKITLKALLVLGLKGEPGDLIDGPAGNALPVGREANLVIANEPYEGKEFYKIQWVNKIGGGMEINRADAGAARAKLAKLNLSGELAKIKALNPDLVAADLPF